VPAVPVPYPVGPAVPVPYLVSPAGLGAVALIPWSGFGCSSSAGGAMLPRSLEAIGERGRRHRGKSERLTAGHQRGADEQRQPGSDEHDDDFPSHGLSSRHCSPLFRCRAADVGPGLAVASGAVGLADGAVALADGLEKDPGLMRGLQAPARPRSKHLIELFRDHARYHTTKQETFELRSDPLHPAQAT